MTVRKRREHDTFRVYAPHYLRKRVLDALGNRCVKCGTKKALQVDHIFNDGKAHREALGTTSIERWMCEHYERLGLWPGGFQLLCPSCHQNKTLQHRGGTPVPPRKGYVQLNVALPESLGEQLSAMAVVGDFKGSKSAVIEASLHAFFAGHVDKTVVENVHTHLATMETTLHRAYKDIPIALDKLCETLERLQSRVDVLERVAEQRAIETAKDHERRYTQLVEAFDRLTRMQSTQRQGWFARMFL